MRSFEPVLRDVPRLCIHLNGDESRRLWDALRALSQIEDAVCKYSGVVFPNEVAQELEHEIEPGGECWTTLTNEEIWVCIRSIIEDQPPDSNSLLDQLTAAAREM